MRLARPSKYSDSRKARLRKRRAQNGQHCAEFGELESLLAALPRIKHRLGLTHGDLHGQNVRVAGNEAILIDFASIADGPLTVDPAALDVSLMIDTQIIKGEDWIKVADEAYRMESLMAPAIPPRPEDPSANLLDAIQYARQMAFSIQLTPYEYPCVIALQLLRKASYAGPDGEQERRRQFAYRLADRLIKDIARRMRMHVEHNVA
ncbi:phosphotransferase [Bradyrhizobium macuxiense]|nr:phosphotransferase [Bradyrhizobium macuxiense]